MESEARSGGGRGDRGVSSGVRRRRRPPKDILIDFSLIKLGRMLGQGATAVVRHGFYSYAYRKKREVAIKVCMCDEVTEKSTADFIREANIIASLDHPNVLKVVGVCMVPPACWIVTEFCSQGSLFDYLQSRAEAAAAAAAATAANDAVLTVSALPTVYGGVGGSGGGEGEAGGARMGDIFGSGAARGFSAFAKAKEKPQSAKEKERGGRGKSTSTHGRKAKTGSKGFSRKASKAEKAYRRAQEEMKEISSIALAQPLTWTERLELALGAAQGVAYIHSRGIYHGDVKPDNFLVNEKGQVKLADFGTSEEREGR
jgi:hypothetical protein